MAAHVALDKELWQLHTKSRDVIHLLIVPHMYAVTKYCGEELSFNCQVIQCEVTCEVT